MYFNQAAKVSCFRNASETRRQPPGVNLYCNLMATDAFDPLGGLDG